MMAQRPAHCPSAYAHSHMCESENVCVCALRGWQGSSCWLKATPPHKAPQKKTAGNMNHCQVGPDEDTGSMSPEFTGLIWQPSCDPLSGTCHVCRVWAYSHANDVRFGQNVNETRHTVHGSKPNHMTVVPRTAQDEINTTFDIQTWQPKPGIVLNNEEFAKGTTAPQV